MPSVSIVKPFVTDAGDRAYSYRPLRHVSVSTVLRAVEYHRNGEIPVLTTMQRILDCPAWVIDQLVERIFRTDAHRDFGGKNRVTKVWHYEDSRDLRVEFESEDECLERLYRVHLKEHWQSLNVPQREEALRAVGINPHVDEPRKGTYAIPSTITDMEVAMNMSKSAKKETPVKRKKRSIEL